MLVTSVLLVSCPIAFAQSTAPAPPQGNAQKPAPAASTEPAKPTDEQQVKEVGGRLVITGDTVVVTADPDRPAQDASIATKTDTPLIETPRSLSVTERQTLDDRQTITITDVHDYTVGMMTFDERGPAYARGFSVNFYDLRRDGLRTYAWSVREPVGLERVQYLRGPNSVLYGDGSPGAIVNLVLRKPLPVQRTEVTASAGELGFGRVTGDVTGPIGGRNIRYRVIGAAEWLDGGYDNGERRLSLLPMLSIDLGRRATLNLDGELYHQRGRAYRHVIPVTPDTQHGDFSHIPWDLNPSSPDSGWSGWNASPGVRLDVQFNASTSLHTAVRYTRIGGNLDFEGLAGLDADGMSIDRFQYRELSTWQELQSDSFVTKTGRTGTIAHSLVVGAEAGLSTADSEIGVGAAPSLSLITPVYLPRISAPALLPTRYDVARIGVYTQDQMHLGSSVVVVPGFRVSRLGTHDRVATGGDEQESSEVKASPSLGVVVLPRPWLSVYASGAQGFEPPTPGEYQADGRALDVADSVAFETGVKLAPRAGRLAVTGDTFTMRRTNVPEADGLGFYRQIGEGRSHGVELEVVGGVVAGLGVQGGYAWTRTDITRSDTGTVGLELPDAPHHTANVWTHYRFRDGLMRGTMLGAGVVYVSDRFTAGDNVNIAPAYTRLDLSGSYELPGHKVRLGVAVPNATNVRYATAGAGSQLYAGSARRLSVQLSTSF